MRQWIVLIVVTGLWLVGGHGLAHADTLDDPFLDWVESVAPTGDAGAWRRRDRSHAATLELVDASGKRFGTLFVGDAVTSSRAVRGPTGTVNVAVDQVRRLGADPRPHGQLTRALVDAATAIAHDPVHAEPMVAVPENISTLRRRGGPLFGPLGVLLGLAAAGLWVYRPPRTWDIVWTFRLNHLLPSIIQLLLFGYWALYWSHGLSAQAPLILAQLLFAYAFDALFSLYRTGTWRVTFGPLPIVLSMNLFVWFGPRSYLPYLIIGAAIASKQLVTWSNGRHVFNPSAFGITVVALATYAFASLDYQAPGAPFNLAPNMTELILLLALVPQARFPIALVSLSAFLGLWALQNSQAFGIQPPSPTWPTVVLVLALFATDPMTIPRTPGGKVLFGGLLGLCIPITSELLDLIGPDAIAKVVPIPFLAFLVPFLDRLANTAHARWRMVLPAFMVALVVPTAAWLAGQGQGHVGLWVGLPLWVMFLGWLGGPASALRRLVDAALSPKLNAVHMGLWVLIVTLAHMQQKPKLMEENLHAVVGTPGIHTDDDGLVTCADNPAFCEVWSWGHEWRAWRTATP